jgi:hypothetical protein
MKRGGPIQRKTRLARGTKPLATRSRLRRANAGRKAKNLDRAHGSPERRAWMKTQPCAICGRVPSDAAHVKNGGGSRKADAALTVPLCSDGPGALGHHAEYDGRKHAGGKRTFEKKYGVDMLALAAATDARWTLSHPQEYDE